MATATQLTTKKLVITTPDGSVYVFQDGSATHVGATVQYDDAFRSGAQPSGTTSGVDKIYVNLGTMTTSYDSGREFTFSITGSNNWMTNANGVRILPLSKVEFYSDTPDTYASVEQESWQLHEQTGTVRIFYGFVDTMVSSSESSSIEVTCRDGLWKSKDVSIYRDFANGIEIPRIIINPNLDRENPDYWYAIKDKDGAGTYGYGESDQDSTSMSLKEILGYLEDEYITELGNAECVTPANGVFDSADIASLPDITPTQITLDSAYWGEAVRSILGQWAPDYALIQDPRTLVFRIVQWAASIREVYSTTTGNTSNTGGGGYESTVGVDDPTKFSATPGATGNRVRIVDADGAQIQTITAIVSSQLRFEDDFERTFTTGTRVYPILGTTNATLRLFIDDASDVTATLSAQGAYSAINLVSVNQEVNSTTLRWDPNSLPGELNKGWDEAFEAAWSPEDEDREVDYGISGIGMQVYDIDTSGAYDVLKIKYSESNWGDNHEADEWNGTACWVFSIAGGTNAKNDGLQYVIRDFALTSDVGDGSPGFLVTVDSADFVTAVGGSFGTSVSPVSSVIDRIGFTNALERGATDFNQKWKIGRMWAASKTGISTSSGQDAAQIHFQICQAPIIRAPSGAFGSGQGISAGNGSFGYPRSNPAVIAYDGPWEILATGGVGSFQIARLGVVSPRPLVGTGPSPQGCGTRGWRPPKSVEVNLETTTLNVRAARCPASGFAGGAYEAYGLERKQDILVSGWQFAAQDSDYEELACSLWRIHQAGDHQGSVTMHGIKEHAAWIDLGLRCELRTRNLVAGSNALLDGFWGALSTITLDFDACTTTFDFATKSGLGSFTFTTLETLKGVKTKTDVQENLQSHMAQVIACNTNARIQAPSGNHWDTRTLSVGGRPAAPGLRVPNKDNAALRLAPTAIDMPNENSGQSTSLGAKASQTVVRDASGGYHLITPAGSIVPGTVASGVFTPDLTSVNRLVASTDLIRDGVSGLTSAVFGGSPEEEVGPIWTTIASSTTTTITTDYTGVDTDEFAGGTLLIVDYDPENPRHPITITSNTDAGVFTVPTITQDLPMDGTLAIIYPAPKPQGVVDDFASGSYSFKDLNGEWVTMDLGTGELHATQEVSGELSDVAPDTRELSIGPAIDTGTISALTMTAQSGVTWDFSAADGVLLPSGAPKTEVGAISVDSGDAKFYDGSTEQTLVTRAGISTHSWEWRPDGRITSDFNTSGTLANRDISVVESGYEAFAMDAWEDAKKEGQGFQWTVPPEIDPTQAVECKAWFRLSGTIGSTSIEIEWSGRAVADNEAAGSGGATFSGSKIQSLSGYTSTDMIVVDLGTFIPSSTLGADDFVHGVIYRDAQVGNADDTFTGSVQIAAIRWTGTRSF